MVTFRCYQCKAEIQVGSEGAGKATRCPKCNTKQNAPSLPGSHSNLRSSAAAGGMSSKVKQRIALGAAILMPAVLLMFTWAEVGSVGFPGSFMRGGQIGTVGGALGYLLARAVLSLVPTTPESSSVSDASPL